MGSERKVEISFADVKKITYVVLINKLWEAL